MIAFDHLVTAFDHLVTAFGLLRGPHRIGVLVLLAIGAAGCDSDAVVFHPESQPERLSDWNLMQIRDGALLPNPGVEPFDLNTPLFTDYAHKLRTVWMPEGTRAEITADGDIEFPVGAILAKTFYYPLAGATAEKSRVQHVAMPDLELDERGGLALDGVRLMETRLLVHRESGWVALPYVWNEEQTEAHLEIAGDATSLTLVYDDGHEQPFPYLVPDANQCAGCHATNHTEKKVLPVGPKVRHLNRTFAYPQGERNQLEHWAAVGYLPAIDPATAPRNAVATDFASGSLDERARSYLDINCGHCHNPSGPADTSGLFLDHETMEERRLGVCKPPIAAGRGSGGKLVSIHPGRPEDSIMVFRMDSVDPGIAMPELGRATVHREGVELISEWILALAGDCQPAMAIGG